MEYDTFLRTFFKIFDRYAPMKKKIIEDKPCHFYDQGSKKSNYD